eukprot:s4945_g4.t1
MANAHYNSIICSGLQKALPKLASLAVDIGRCTCKLRVSGERATPEVHIASACSQNALRDLTTNLLQASKRN